MRLQRYPDGANEWMLSVWGRHPEWSWTWTHAVTITKHRRESGQRRWGFYYIPGHQARRGVTLFGISLCLTTQASIRKKADQ